MRPVRPPTPVECAGAGAPLPCPAMRPRQTRRVALAATASAALLLSAGCGDGDGRPPVGVPWNGDFETGNTRQWKGERGGSGRQTVANDRIRVIRNPVRQGRYAARFEVRRGDRWRDSGGNRAELLHWTAEREGDRRQYEWSTRFAEDYPITRRGFQIVTQWHANEGGTQPPLFIFVSGDQIGLKSVRSSASGRPEPSRVLWRAPLARGSWHGFRLRVRWSSDPRRGRVTLYHNGRLVLRDARVATLIPGTINYLKQGLYRSDDISGTGVVYHDGMRVRRIA